MSIQNPTLEPVTPQLQPPGQTGGISNALHRFFNNLTGMLEYQRTANVFKTIQAAAANNTVWTPAVGTKFRLMQFEIELPSNVAISGGAVVCTLSFEDAAGNQIGLAYDFFCPATSVATGNGSTVVTVTLPGNGYLSTTANNILNAKLSTALTTGAFRITARGCEE